MKITYDQMTLTAPLPTVLAHAQQLIPGAAVRLRLVTGDAGLLLERDVRLVPPRFMSDHLELAGWVADEDELVNIGYLTIEGLARVREY